MNKTENNTECDALQQDYSVYLHLSNDTSPTIFKELNSPAARFYGLPKIHTNNMPMHPIVSACGTATYNTAKFITKILQNYCGKTSSFVKDSTDFIK